MQPASPARSALYVGLMSGTSLDGVDGVLAAFPGPQPAAHLTAVHLGFPPALKEELMALQAAGANEIEREALAANQLATIYAECVRRLLATAGVQAGQVAAIGVHGQTIRHRPALGYTRQTNNAALLAELTGIDVVADFRSRDVAAGGQGAPLVPAFHQAMFGSADQTRVVANIGGISNVSVLRPEGEASGFDTGPGNMLMDHWINAQRGLPYDENGAWAASGKVVGALLDSLLAEPYLQLPPPKSTGRDLFSANWLEAKLAAFRDLAPVDVQATLAAYTARTLAEAILAHAHDCASVHVCGGGAMNGNLMRLLQSMLGVPVDSTAALGVAPNHVEALAFAWLAMRFCERMPGNLPAVTGARGARILGALYPA